MCAFDSLFQLILSAMASNPDYFKLFTESGNKIAQLATKVLTRGQTVTSADYKERALILLNLGLFQIEAFTRTIKRLNAECNVAHLSQYVFSDTPSYKTKVSCPCGNNFTSKSIIFNIEVDVLLCEGFDFMQKAIDNGHKINRVCGKCNTLVQDEIDYGPHIIIDTTKYQTPSFT